MKCEHGNEITIVLWFFDDLYPENFGGVYLRGCPHHKCTNTNVINEIENL